MQNYQKAASSRRKVTSSEVALWEDHWLTCAKKLQQWDELTKYAKQTNVSQLIWRVTGKQVLSRT